MTIDEFQQYATDMETFYDQKLNEKEKEVWFKNLEKMSLERFNYILDTLYRQSKRMPKLSDILETNKRLPRELKETPKRNKCEKCGGSGYLQYTKIINGLPYQYACICGCGRYQKYDGRKVEDENNKSDYYIPTEQELNMKIKSNREITPQGIVKAMNMLNHTNIVNDEIKGILRKKYIELTRK